MDILLTSIYLSPYYIAPFLGALAVVLFLFTSFHKPHVWLFFVLVMMFLLPIFTGGSLGSLLRQVIFSGLFIYSAYYVFFYLDKRFIIPDKLLPFELIIFIVFIAISLSWSPDLMASVKRFMQLIGVLLIALMFSVMLEKGKNIQAILVIPVLLFLFLGFLMIVIQPSVAFDSTEAFRGVANHKNTWGLLSLLAGILMLICCCFGQKKRRWYLLGLTIAFVSLILSKSTTSLLVFLLVFMFVMVWLFFLNYKRAFFVTVVLVVIFSTVLVHGYFVITGDWLFEFILNKVLGGAGKDLSLTGRTYLWELMFNEINKHLWLGIGYGGFWTGEGGASAYLATYLNWGHPTQAHNGYIDVLNEIGVVGLVLLFVLMLFHAFRLKKLLQSDPRDVALIFYVAIFISVLILNVSETFYLRTTHLWWILFCMSLVDVYRRYRILISTKV